MTRILLVSLLALVAGCSAPRGVGLAGGGSWDGTSGRGGSMMALSIPLGP